MKHSILMATIGVALLMSACSVKSTKTPYAEMVYTIDYYTAGLDGKVLLTEATSVSFDYVSLGSILVEARNGYEVIGTKTSIRRYKDFNENFNGRAVEKEETIVENEYGKYIQANPAAVLRKASEAALEMGGDAIIGLRLTPLVDIDVDDKGDTHRRHYGYNISGMVVKRK